jgi:hypothetical protein
MYKTLAKNAVAGALLAALVLPTVASPSLDDRHSIDGRHVAERQPTTRPAAVSQKPAPKFNGYYGPVTGPSAHPKPLLFGVGGRW